MRVFHVKHPLHSKKKNHLIFETPFRDYLHHHPSGNRKTIPDIFSKLEHKFRPPSKSRGIFCGWNAAKDWARKKRKPEASSSPSLRWGGQERRSPCFTVPPTAARSKSTEDRERSFADPCIEISIYNDVKDRRSGAFVIQREARDPDGRGPGPNLYIASPRRGRLILRESRDHPKCG